MFGGVFFVSKSLWWIERQKKLESFGSMLEYWYIERGLLVVVLRFSRASWTLLWLVQYQIYLLESNPNAHGFPSFTVIKKAIAWILSPLSKFLSPRISKFYVEATISGPGSFTVQSGDHSQSCDHLQYNLGIICGAVQTLVSRKSRLRGNFVKKIETARRT